MRRNRPWVGLAFIAATFLGSTLSCQRPGDTLQPGNHRKTLDSHGTQRWYLIHVPPKAQDGTPLPLVVAFHGGGGEPAGFQSYSGLDEVADREGFVVVYPAGTGPLARRLLTWNAGPECCGRAAADGVDDVGFFRALVDQVGRSVAVDPAQVYATGHSNGGMMAYRVAAEASDLVAAVVSVSGSMQLDSIQPARPVPVLQIHSVDDPRAPYGGGDGPPFPLGGAVVSQRSVEHVLSLWAQRNQCSGSPQPLEPIRDDPGSGHTAEHLAWGDCPATAPVELWRLHGPGHGWPGSVAPLPLRRPELLGPPTQVLSGAEEVWKFLRRFRR